MVAAISHDLRTPITRLKLRAEFIDDPEQREKMLRDLDEMETMIRESLALAREDANPEPRAKIDLAQLLADSVEGMEHVALEIDPADARMLGDWARQVGASEKTLQRAFVKSTGLSFQQWRTHARMTKALAMHRCGARLLDVAVAVGYSSEGAYAHAFRQFYGYSPGRMKPRSTGDRTD